MKTKKLICVLNICAALIILSITVASVMNSIHLNQDLQAVRVVFDRQALAFDAWLANISLSLPVVFALSVLTLEDEIKESVWTLFLIIGAVFMEYHIFILIEAYVATGSYFKMLFWIFVTLWIISWLLLLIPVIRTLKEDYLKKMRAADNT